MPTALGAGSPVLGRTAPVEHPGRASRCSGFADARSESAVSRR